MAKPSKHDTSPIALFQQKEDDDKKKKSDDPHEHHHQLFDDIVLSLPFSDHCHEAMLVTMPSNIPIFAANGSYQQIKKYFQKHNTIRSTCSGDGTTHSVNRVVVDLCTTSGVALFQSQTGPKFQNINSKYGILDPTHGGIQFLVANDKDAII